MFGSYHVSQQNTFTGRLTEAMFDHVLTQAWASARARSSASGRALR
jgi:uracil-DNA glycosylase